MFEDILDPKKKEEFNDDDPKYLKEIIATLVAENIDLICIMDSLKDLFEMAEIDLKKDDVELEHYRSFVILG